MPPGIAAILRSSGESKVLKMAAEKIEIVGAWWPASPLVTRENRPYLVKLFFYVGLCYIEPQNNPTEYTHTKLGLN